jgi:hypothetical protein
MGPAAAKATVGPAKVGLAVRGYQDRLMTVGLAAVSRFHRPGW